jgi:hypothetical protein
MRLKYVLQNRLCNREFDGLKESFADACAMGGAICLNN